MRSPSRVVLEPMPPAFERSLRRFNRHALRTAVDGVRAYVRRGGDNALAPDDARRAAMLHAAEAHLDAALPHVAGEYMGEHWLASFAVLALDE